MTNIADFLRTISLGQLIATILMTGIAAYRYFDVFKIRHMGRNQMKWHVILFIIVWPLCNLYIVANMLSREGMPFSWRIPVGYTVFILGDIAVFLALNDLNEQRQN